MRGESPTELSRPAGLEPVVAPVIPALRDEWFCCLRRGWAYETASRESSGRGVCFLIVFPELFWGDQSHPWAHPLGLFLLFSEWLGFPRRQGPWERNSWKPSPPPLPRKEARRY